MSNLWNPIDSPVSKFILSDYLSPGICLGPEGAAVKRRLDERRGYGIDQAYLIYTGRDLVPFTMRFTLITREDWRQWREEFQPLIQQTPTRGVVRQSNGGYTPGRAHTIWHPMLISIGVDQCVVEEEPQEDLDDFMRTVVAIKFRQVTPVPRQAFARPEAPAQPTPLSEDQKEIQRLTDTLGSLRQTNKAAGG